MQWYAAHIILYVKLKQKAQQRYTFWENIILIKAASEEEAWNKAERRGRGQAGDDDGTFRWGGEPAEWVFAGVRKLTLCEDEESRPSDGTEVSYLEMEVDSKTALSRLLNGHPVRVLLRDNFGDNESVNGVVGVDHSGDSVAT
jgi:Domain of unknown function (DUF4288)